MVIVIVVNGSKMRASEFAEKLCAQLQSEHHTRLLLTEHRSHAKTLATESAFCCDVLICIGGDGTISECAGGIAEAMRFKQKENCCLLLPVAFGTGNDFVRNLGIDTTADKIIQRLHLLSPVRCDIFFMEGADSTLRYFVNECSAGLGPEVVHMADQFPSFIKGSLRFHLAILAAFIRYKKKSIKIVTSEFTFQGPAIAVVCANGKFFGGGIGIAPDAKINDGLLNITVVGDVGLFEYLRYLPALKRGEKIAHPEIHYLHSESAQIVAENLEADGEFIETGQFKIKISPYQLRFI
jgi:YegS/Rv2252/BmrU family lipid kinase